MPEDITRSTFKRAQLFDGVVLHTREHCYYDSTAPNLAWYWASIPPLFWQVRITPRSMPIDLIQRPDYLRLQLPEMQYSPVPFLHQSPVHYRGTCVSHASLPVVGVPLAPNPLVGIPPIFSLIRGPLGAMEALGVPMLDPGAVDCPSCGTPS
jgi:hypothetical protein